MAFNEIQFDPNSVPLRSDLRVLATIRIPGQPDHSLYLDSNGQKQGIPRADYISEENEPGLFKRDEVSVVSNWPRFGGPNVVILPEGQRLLLGELAQGATVDVALWRKFIRAQTFSNRILVAATESGIAAFQPRPGTVVTPKAEPIYRDTKQEVDVQKILNSITDAPLKPTVPMVPATVVSTPYIEVPELVSDEAPESLAESEELPETPDIPNEIQEVVVVEPEPEPANQVVIQRPQKSSKVLLAISDLLITFAIFAILYAGYQTVWSMFVSQQITSEVKAEVELKWTESPAAPPELHKGFSLIYIPRLKDKVWELPITHGVAADDLKAGMGHYPESEMPGEAGTFALAGHRSTYGEPLAYIDQLQQDDEVIIKTSENWYVYKLVLDAIVEPDELWVLDDNPAGIVNRTGVSEVITITTCDPRWGSTHRWIWWGQLTAVLPIDETPEAITANEEGAA